MRCDQFAHQRWMLLNVSVGLNHPSDVACLAFDLLFDACDPNLRNSSRFELKIEGMTRQSGLGRIRASLRTRTIELEPAQCHG